MMAKNPKWGSPQMKRAIARHDRQFARKHGGGKPPKGGACLLVLVALAGLPAVAAVASARGWA